MPRTIPEVLQDLPTRTQGENIPQVRAKYGMPFQTMYLGPDNGDISEILQDCIALKAEGHISAYVVRPRTDGNGQYICLLLTRQQALNFAITNQGYRLLERGQVRAMAKADIPSWAKRGDEPEHIFAGFKIPLDENSDL